MNTQSSPTELASSLSLLDVSVALLERGRVSEALEYILHATLIAAAEDVDEAEVLKMTVDDYIRYMYPKPLPVVRGRWDNVIYGEAAYR